MDELEWEALEDHARRGGRLMFWDADGIPEGEWLMLPGPSLDDGRRTAPAKREDRRPRSAKKRRKRLAQ